MFTSKMKIFNTLETYIKSKSQPHTRDIVVAFSGGVDSHVLLHALSNLRIEFGFNLHAIHIHHGLSQYADVWQSHCKQVCEVLNVEFQTAKVELQNSSRTSLEALARDARYKKIAELVPEHSHVFLGQHQDDQLETFLLQLKRGAGPKGLSAMNQTWQAHDLTGKAVTFHRPLLTVSQQDILAYAQQHQLNWCEDESNQNTDFERNFLRHEVLPVLQNRWPELAKSVSRSASLCAQQQDMLDEVCAEKLSRLENEDKSLDIAGLLELSVTWINQVVRFWLAQQGIQSPSLAVLERLLPDVLKAADDANPILQWQTWQFRRFNQQLYVIKVQDKVEPTSFQWTGQEQVVLPQNVGALQFESQGVSIDNGIRFNLAVGDILIELARYGKRFKPVDAPHSKPLKQWFKVWQVPPWKRDRVIQLVQNDRIIGLFIDGKWIVSSELSETTERRMTVSYLP
ncbi:tRNA lysidine(34) synthetase TilS [Paraglaciecola aquimarina]|uniref:tRNA(Ile)-lysidine synthase n=1 Tax=Paraglaciecola algarum TaxID=3050085 RepID=A0ABS9DB42_9ALTE|nr:tRNA lysidine(34) synthetase TilS [Paraglaciecola sp. G1-23]MCF2950143.1 tRNA lysidine(34) synthetase TilS [Paraglaciecola sp. G1-23]